MSVSPELDSRFREAAAAQNLLDVAYDLVDTPIGRLLVACSERGVCRLMFGPRPSVDVSWRRWRRFRTAR